MLSKIKKYRHGFIIAIYFVAYLILFGYLEQRGLVVMSLHLGFHWNIAVAMAGRLWEHPSVIRTWAARSVATTIAGYGLYAFYRRQIGDYLIMRMHFVFYDYEKGIFPFLLDYLAVMILIAFIGYYSGVFLKKTGRRKRKGSY